MSKSIPSITIGNRLIGPEHPPFIVAVLSANHNGALATIDAIAESGADAVKLQTYTADTMTLSSTFALLNFRQRSRGSPAAYR